MMIMKFVLNQTGGETYLDEHDLLEMLAALHPKKGSQDSGISVLKTDNEILVKRITALELQMIKMQEIADDLESEIEARRSGDLDRRIERDLIVVREARALLAEQEQDHE